jgi:hypothetical protein
MATRRALVAGTTSVFAEINGTDNLEVSAGGVISSAGPLVLGGFNNVVQIPGSDTLDVTTIDRTGTISIGTSSATGITIGSGGAGGVLTTIAGDLSVTGNESITGTSTFTADATFNGNVQFGDGTGTDLVEFHTATRIGSTSFPDLTLSNDANHSLFAAQSASETVGRNLSVAAGAGGNTAASAAGGAGGSMSVTGGAGGTGDGTYLSGSGGSLLMTGGPAGADGAAGGSSGGSVGIFGGVSSGDVTGPSVTVQGGESDSAGDGNGGAVFCYGGNSYGTGTGGRADLIGGYANGTGDGGPTFIEGGSADSTGDGGVVRIRGGAGTVNGNIVIGDTQTVQVQIGAAAIPTVVGGVLQGPDDGTGVVLGHTPTANNTGSAPQLVSVATDVVRDYLVEAPGMMVWHSGSNQLQYYDGTSWTAVPTSSSAGGWTDDGTIVRLTTSSDSVAIGTASLFGTEKLRVVGDAHLTGDIDFATGAARELRVQQAAADTNGNDFSFVAGEAGAMAGATARFGGIALVQGGKGGASASASTASKGGRGRLYGGDGGDNSSTGDSGDGGNIEIVAGASPVPSGSGNQGTGGQTFIVGGFGDTGGETVLRGGFGNTTDGDIRIATEQTANLNIGFATLPINLRGQPNILDVSASNLANLDFTDGDSAPVSAAAHGRIRYNETTNRFEVSENGGAWTQMVGGATAGGWTDDGTIVRLTTSSDSVAIGTSSLFGTEKLRVLGQTDMQGDLEFELGADRYIKMPQNPAGTLFGNHLYIQASQMGDQSGGSYGYAGDLYLLGGDGGAHTTVIPYYAGAVNIQGGEGASTSASGLEAGKGGDVGVIGGRGGDQSTDDDGGAGGNIYIRGGQGRNPSGTGADGLGGNVYITGGANSTPAKYGFVQIGGSQTLYLEVGVPVQGPDDGTGLVIGHTPTGATTGSAPQIVSVATDVVRGQLVPAAGMMVWHAGSTQMQYYDGTSWTPFASGSGSGWTDDGTVVRLTTATDNVAIGVATMSGSEKLRVVGDSSLQGDIDFETGATRAVSVKTAASEAAGNALSVAAGAGGASAGSAAGGVGGAASVSGGKGGDTDGTLAGGAGGAASVSGGVGGAGGIATLGGVGGAVTVSGGTGGPSGGGGAGAGGALNVLGGVGGGGAADGALNLGTSQTSVITMGGGGATIAAKLVDNSATAFVMEQGTDDYIVVNTTNGTEAVSFGNTATNPNFGFLGTGTVSLAGTGQKLELSADGYIGFDERTTDPATGANEGALYTKDDGGVTQLFYRASASGTVHQLTPAAPANSEYVGVAGENIDAGESVCIDWDTGTSTARVYKTDADATDERANAIGVATTTSTTGNAVTVQLTGESAVIADAQWDSAPATTDAGKAVYMSQTAGNLTITAPTGNVTVQQLGWVSIGGSGVTKIIVNPMVQLKKAS